MQFAAMDLHFNLLLVVGFQAVVTETAVRTCALPVRRAETRLIMFRLLNRPNQFGLAHVPRLYPEASGLISNLSYLHRAYPVTPI
jgi:hypothetical protein